VDRRLRSVSSCCTRGYSRVFGKRQARKDARRYRRKGLDDTAQRIVDALAARGVRDATVLEVGGGVGAIEIELLEAGANHATVVEISEAYDDEARALLLENGLQERVERRHGDFVQAESEVEPADVVVMHRVVCCYPDPDALVGAAARHARRLLALSFPRDTWWLRLGSRIVNLWFRTVCDFESFVHSPVAIIGAASAHGLTPVREHRGRIWRIAVLERS
jgi:2-polyprenyl-3-methyl-5-hydroxy-6-metoxy-1,4-benzoquinol methylase